MKIIETLALLAALLIPLLAQSAKERTTEKEEIIRILSKAHRAADKGHIESQRAIAQAYAVGLGDYPKDPQKAFKWFLKAAKQGDIESAVEVGTAYRDGVGTGKDLKEAVRWLEMATSAGDLQGRFEFAMLRMDKTRSDQEKRIGLALLQENVLKNHPLSLWMMGLIYSEGILVKQNDKLAVEHWVKAVQGGSNAAAFSLGMHYFKDTKRRDEGLSLIRSSAKNKFRPAEDFLKANP
jgi:TPR repeat protein